MSTLFPFFEVHPSNCQRIKFLARTLSVSVLVLVAQLQMPAHSESEHQSLPTGSTTSAAQNALLQQTNAGMCAQCHGTFGVSEPGSNIPSLAGLSSEKFYEKMQAFRLASPTTSVMARLARGLSDEQVKSAGLYFENQATSFSQGGGRHQVVGASAMASNAANWVVGGVGCMLDLWTFGPLAF